MFWALARVSFRAAKIVSCNNKKKIMVYNQNYFNCSTLQKPKKPKICCKQPLDNGIEKESGASTIVIIVGKISKQDSIILKTICREKRQANICEVPCRASTCYTNRATERAFGRSEDWLKLFDINCGP
jgi:hypothetical protein